MVVVVQFWGVDEKVFEIREQLKEGYKCRIIGGEVGQAERTERSPIVNEMTSERPWLEVAQVQPGDGQVFNMAEGGEVVRIFI